MQKDKLNVAIVGTGRWARFAHAPGVKGHPRAELIAVCSRTRPNAEAMAREFDVPHVFTDYAELMKMDGLDAVVVATTNVTHHPICMAAIERGRHVFCEKPLGMNLAETRELLEAAETAGVKHMVAFTCRWLPDAIRVKQLMEAGYVGRVYHINVHKMAGYAGGEAPRRWRFDKARSGGGVLADLGSHMIDLARWYLGEIRSVCGHAPTFVPQRRDPDGTTMLDCKVDDATAFIAEFECGAQGVFHISWVAHKGHNQTIDICGDKGTLEFYADPEAWKLSLSGSQVPDDRREPLDVPAELTAGIDADAPEGGFGSFIRNYSGMSRRFIDVIVNDEPPSPSFHDGMKTQEIMEAITISAQERRWVDLPLGVGG